MSNAQSVLQSSMQIILLQKKAKTKGGVRETFDNIPHTDEIKEIKRDKEGEAVKDSGGNFVYINRAIRYSPGETSIYIDEQADTSRGQNIIIYGGGSFIGDQQVNKLEYLNKCNYNKSNPQRRDDVTALFRVYNREDVFQKHLDKQDLVIDAKGMAKAMDLEELKAFLMVLSKNPRSLSSLDRMPASEIRHEAYRLCTEDPKTFLEGIKSADSRTKLIIVTGITFNVIKFNKVDNTLRWSSTDEILSKAPKGMDAINFFIEEAKSNAEKADMIDMIKSRTTGASSKSVVKEVHVHMNMYETLVADAIDAEVVIRNGTWISYEGEKYKGNSAFITALKADGLALFTKLATDYELSQSKPTAGAKE